MSTPNMTQTSRHQGGKHRALGSMAEPPGAEMLMAAELQGREIWGHQGVTREVSRDPWEWEGRGPDFKGKSKFCLLQDAKQNSFLWVPPAKVNGAIQSPVQENSPAAQSGESPGAHRWSWEAARGATADHRRLMRGPCSEGQNT